MRHILFISDHLLSGGKERRLSELLLELDRRKNFTLTLLLLEGIDADCSIHYKEVLNLKIKILYLGRYNRFQLPFQIYKICKSEKIDLINTWAPAVYTYLIFPSKVFLKIPILNNAITSARNDISTFGMLKIRGTYALSDLILSNSRQALTVFKVPAKKKLVIYNGFRQSRLKNLKNATRLKQSLKISTKFVVAMAAEYGFRKDYPVYIKAANLVLERGYDVTFISMGSGNFEPYLTLVNQQYTSSFIFLQRQRHVESIMNICDIGVLASSVEGIPNSILEFMALGKPVVANSGEGVGTAELVNHNANGFLVTPKNPELMAEKIMDLLRDENKRTEFGKNGRKIVENRFAIEDMVNSYENLYSRYL